MSVFKRKTTGGETQEYHYRFMSGGKDYAGVCEGCTSKRAAEDFERELKKKAAVIATQKTVKALVENHRDELTGGSRISLAEAFDLSLKKPGKRQAGERHLINCKAYWTDFVAFMTATHPEIDHLAAVRVPHAEEYIQHLRTQGRFDKRVFFTSGEKMATYVREGALSPRSVNAFHVSIASVFNKLANDAGVIENPFKAVDKLENNCETREAFTQEELALISQNLTPFVKPIFLIGVATGLREGDICTLRWADVSLRNRLIRRKTLKTGALVEIPIAPPLEKFLREQLRETGDGTFVLPEHATMYQQNPTGITYRFRQFLEGLGVKTTVPGKGRSISVKDVHSLRHTFCYFAGVHGIPLNIVQSIVGHMTPEMTRHYQSHADIKTKHAMMEKMPDLLAMPVASFGDKDEALRREAAALLERATTDQLKAVIKMLTS